MTENTNLFYEAIYGEIHCRVENRQMRNNLRNRLSDTKYQIADAHQHDFVIEEATC